MEHRVQFLFSLKTIPRELREAAIVYRFSRWQRFTELDLPSARLGWCGIDDVGGGRVVLPDGVRDVRAGQSRFPTAGLGSYLQAAASAGDMRAMMWGLATMITVIVLIDQLIWRPVIAWADKFKFEQVESSGTAENSILNLSAKSLF